MDRTFDSSELSSEFPSHLGGNEDSTTAHHSLAFSSFISRSPPHPRCSPLPSCLKLSPCPSLRTTFGLAALILSQIDCAYLTAMFSKDKGRYRVGPYENPTTEGSLGFFHSLSMHTSGSHPLLRARQGPTYHNQTTYTELGQ